MADLELKQDGEVVWATMNRPGRLNALSRGLVTELREFFVIGARSAIFAPVEPLGLVIVDEEHEHTYKQEEAPRYHARDAAAMRARLEGARLILGSATPSLESLQSASEGRVPNRNGLARK